MPVPEKSLSAKGIFVPAQAKSYVAILVSAIAAVILILLTLVTIFLLDSSLLLPKISKLSAYSGFESGSFLAADSKYLNPDGVSESKPNTEANTSSIVKISQQAQKDVSQTLSSKTKTTGSTQQILKLPVFMYHHINTLEGVNPKNAVEIGLRVSPEMFEKQLTYVLSLGYQTITTDDLDNYLQHSTPLPPKPILLTFDDGYTDSLTAAEILKKHNSVGDFAIITGVVGTGGYMNWEEIKSLKQSGMSISSHTINHCYLATNQDPKTGPNGPFAASPVSNLENQACPHFTFGGQLNTAQIKGELGKSKQDLESHLDTKIISIVYPYGKYNQQVVDIATALGYKLGFTVQPQTKQTLDLNKSLELSRIRINGQQSGELKNLQKALGV